MSEHTDMKRVAVISRYDVPSLHLQALSTALNQELQNWVCKRPGFISGAVHKSTDELHIVVYTVWKREEDGINYLQAPEAQELWKIMASSGASYRNSHVYWVGAPVAAA